MVATAKQLKFINDMNKYLKWDIPTKYTRIQASYQIKKMLKALVEAGAKGWRSYL